MVLLADAHIIFINKIRNVKCNRDNLDIAVLRICRADCRIGIITVSLSFSQNLAALATEN